MIERTNEYGQVIARLGIGTYVKPDGWHIGNVLKKGLDGFCDYYLLTNNNVIKELAVNVEITGRTRRRISGDYYVRVKITFVGDCEPDTVSGGWIPASF